MKSANVFGGKMAKYYIGVIAIALLGPMFMFTNCGNQEFTQGDESTQSQLESEADFLIWLDRYKKRAAELREVNTPESNSLAEELETNIAKIEDMIDPTGKNLPHHHTAVLGVRDYLDASYADGGDLILRLDFDTEIAKLKQKDIELEGKIDNLESKLSSELDKVKQELEQKIAAGDAENKQYIQDQLKTVNAQIDALKAADAQAMTLITGLRNDVDENKKQIQNNRDQLEEVEKSLLEAINNNNAELIAQLQKDKAALAAEIAKLQSENVQLNANLNSLTQQHNELAENFITFKSEVNARFDKIEKRITVLESRLSTIDDTVLLLDNRITEVNDTVRDLQRTTAASIQSLKQSILDVRADTESQILELKKLNLELKQKISEQETAFQSLLDSQREVSDLQNKMCKANDTRTTCSGNEADLTADCCISLANLSCEAMFADSTQVTARNQCNVILMTLRNHDEQLKAIKEVDENQNTMIAGLLEDVKNLSQSVDQITASIEEITKAVESTQDSLKEVARTLSSLDQRLLLEEFKSARSEAVAALNERNDHYLAWITRRYADIRNQFCIKRANQAFNKSDYSVARQNHDYCVEKLEQLTRAKELIHVAKSYANGLASINVDKACTATVVNPDTGTAVPVSQFDIEDTRHPTTFRQIFEKCKTGPVLAKSMIMQVVAIQNKLGPDFRNVEYMSRKSKIVSLMYLYKTVDRVPASDILFFEDYDPTSDKNWDTLYGQVERVFVNNYVKNRLRDPQGRYIYEMSKIPQKVAGLDKVQTHAQINSAATSYLARLKDLELKGSCLDCGYKVQARNITTRGGKKYFSYPEDPVSQCPVHADHIISKGTDGKFYSYRIHYSRRRGATEHMHAYYHHHQSGHLPIAKSEADVQEGNFGYCGNRLNNKIVHRFGMPNTHLRGRLVYTYWKPYSRTHGKPQCRRYYFRCVPKANDWTYQAGVSPTSNIMHYLNGFTESKVQAYCTQSGAGYVTKSRALTQDEKAHMRTFIGGDLDSPLQTVQTNTNSVTQLTRSYWQYKDNAIVYGKGDTPFSKTRPIIGTGPESHSSGFFRTVFAPTNYEIPIQQCYDPGSDSESI